MVSPEDGTKGRGGDEASAGPDRSPRAAPLATERPPTRDRFAVLGAGAVGCYFGGMLARAGVAVTLIGRSAHVDALLRDGLRIESAAFDVRVGVRASTDAAAVADADVVLVCVKSPDTDAAARAIAPHLRTGARVVSLQNGVDNARRLRRAIRQPVFAAVVYVGAFMAGPGHVRHTGRGELVLGALPDERERDPSLDVAAHAIAAAFDAAGVRCDVTRDVDVDLWTKLAMNCALNAISALGGTNYGRMVANPAIRALLPDILREVAAVARADGVRLDASALAADCLRLVEAMPAQVSSTAQDLQRRKATEIDALNGYVAERARALGVAAPINRTLHALVKLRESA